MVSKERSTFSSRNYGGGLCSTCNDVRVHVCVFLAAYCHSQAQKTGRRVEKTLRHSADTRVTTYGDFIIKVTE